MLVPIGSAVAAGAAAFFLFLALGCIGPRACTAFYKHVLVPIGTALAAGADSDNFNKHVFVPTERPPAAGAAATEKIGACSESGARLQNSHTPVPIALSFKVGRWGPRGQMGLLLRAVCADVLARVLAVCRSGEDCRGRGSVVGLGLPIPVSAPRTRAVHGHPTNGRSLPAVANGAAAGTRRCRSHAPSRSGRRRVINPRSADSSLLLSRPYWAAAVGSAMTAVTSRPWLPAAFGSAVDPKWVDDGGGIHRAPIGVCYRGGGAGLKRLRWTRARPPII